MKSLSDSPYTPNHSLFAELVYWNMYLHTYVSVRFLEISVEMWNMIQLEMYFLELFLMEKIWKGGTPLLLAVKVAISIEG